MKDIIAMINHDHDNFKVSLLSCPENQPGHLPQCAALWARGRSAVRYCHCCSGTTSRSAWQCRLLFFRDGATDDIPTAA